MEEPRPGDQLSNEWTWHSGLFFNYLLWTADATGKQEMKTSQPAFSHILWIYKNHLNRNSQDIFVSRLLNAVLLVKLQCLFALRKLKPPKTVPLK